MKGGGVLQRLYSILNLGILPYLIKIRVKYKIHDHSQQIDFYHIFNIFDSEELTLFSWHIYSVDKRFLAYKPLTFKIPSPNNLCPIERMDMLFYLLSFLDYFCYLSNAYVTNLWCGMTADITNTNNSVRKVNRLLNQTKAYIRVAHPAKNSIKHQNACSIK